MITREVDAIVGRHPSRVLLLVDRRRRGRAGRRRSRRRSRRTATSAATAGRSARRWSRSARGATRSASSPPRRGRCSSATCRPRSGGTPTTRPRSAARSSTNSRRMADQVIYSSRDWDDPVRGTLATADWVASRPRRATRSPSTWPGEGSAPGGSSSASRSTRRRPPGRSRDWPTSRSTTARTACRRPGSWPAGSPRRWAGRRPSGPWSRGRRCPGGSGPGRGEVGLVVRRDEGGAAGPSGSRRPGGPTDGRPP